MSYLLDKKIKKKKVLNVALVVFLCLVLFYFRIGVFNFLSLIGHSIFRPILIVGNNFGEKLGNLGSFFSAKSALYLENENLKSELMQNKLRMFDYDSLLAENIGLKEILGRKNPARPSGAGGEKVSMTLSAILSKPNRSPYDTLIIDAGTKQGLKVNNLVFASGNVPIGRVAEIYANSAKVILFSNSGEKTQVIVGEKNVFMEIVGRGGGNFEMILPKDLILSKGNQVVLPGIVPYVVATVEKMISDPRDPFVKALLVSPVNVQELKFVEVQK